MSWREFFEKHKPKGLFTDSFAPSLPTEEERYQAFKARLAEEQCLGRHEHEVHRLTFDLDQSDPNAWGPPTCKKCGHVEPGASSWSSVKIISGEYQGDGG